MRCSSERSRLVSDDTGFGDFGPYGGGKGRGMPTPQIYKLVKAARLVVRPCRQVAFPNRSGMATVAFQGQGGGLPKAE